MTTEDYLATLKTLGLTPHAKATASMLGVTLRTAQNYAAGSPIPEPIAKLLALMTLNSGNGTIHVPR